MLAKLRKHLTYANVVSTLCLFILLGGSAFAAVRLSKNSVRSKHIKNEQVQSVDVKNASLLAQDFASGQLPQGEKGERGETGSPGSARAYASVNADAGQPAIFVGPHPGFSSVSRVGPSSGGRYCLTPESDVPAANVDNTVASPEDWGGGFTAQTKFQGASECPSGLFVVTYTGNTEVNYVDFNVIVP